jgi:hypothetical protein
MFTSGLQLIVDVFPMYYFLEAAPPDYFLLSKAELSN